MCDTLQLNWKLPTTPVDAISSPLSSIRDSNVNVILNNNVTNSSSNRNKEASVDDKVKYRKENLNNNSRIISSRDKRAVRSDSKSAMSKNSKTKLSNRKNDGKYVLRECSIKKRNEVEVKKAQPKKRGPKPRPKPQPMSKYRRKTANLRERERMGEINNAFEHLKEKIPTPLVIADSTKSCNSTEKRNNRCEKMTKINVLHIAINYIRALESILDTGDAGTQVYGTSIIQSPRLSVPNSLVDNLEMIKENSNVSNEIPDQMSSMNNKNVRNKCKELLKSIQCPTKSKKIPRKTFSTPKCGLQKGKSSKVKEKTIDQTKKNTNIKRELLFNANICEQLNQLKPVMPTNFLETSSVLKNQIVNNTCTQEQHADINEEGDNEIENYDKYCPDWTELTPTLEFPVTTSNLEQRNFVTSTSNTSKTEEGFLSTQFTAVHNHPKIQSDVNSNKPAQSSDNHKNVLNSYNSSTGTTKAGDIHNKCFGTQPLQNSSDTSIVTAQDEARNSDYTTLNCSSQSRGNLDTLLSSAASNAKHLPEKDKFSSKINFETPNSYAQRKLKTVPKAGINFLNCDLVFKANVPWLTNSPSPPIFGRQPSFPDVFGASDDPDYLFEELTKTTFSGDGSTIWDEDQENSYSATCLGSYPKTFSMSSGNGSILSSDGSASSPEETETTIMDYIDDTFQISI